MSKFFLRLSLLFSAAGFAQAGAPAMPYYNGFNFNQSGIALRTSLAYKITDTHLNILTYQQAENALKIVDLDPEDGTNSNVLLIYGFSNGLCPSAQPLPSQKCRNRRDRRFRFKYAGAFPAVERRRSRFGSRGPAKYLPRQRKQQLRTGQPQPFYRQSVPGYHDLGRARGPEPLAFAFGDAEPL